MKSAATAYWTKKEKYTIEFKSTANQYLIVFSTKQESIVRKCYLHWKVLLHFQVVQTLKVCFLLSSSQSASGLCSTMYIWWYVHIAQNLNPYETTALSMAIMVIVSWLTNIMHKRRPLLNETLGDYFWIGVQAFYLGVAIIFPTLEDKEHFKVIFKPLADYVEKHELGIVWYSDWCNLWSVI